MRKSWLIALSGAAFLWPVFSFENSEVSPEPDPEIIAAAYPKDYFQKPIGAEVKLAGTFGELRPDHFHAGLDIKSSTGRIGQAVFAAAEGFVDRIQVMSNGYGNVIYIKHPNGYSTVYGHLDRFAPELENYVREAQYKKERFQVDLRPPDNLFPVKKGQEIAKLGNSGSSLGPHLHFEIRNTATQKVLNPLLFGIPVIDDLAPEIRDMKIYFLNEHREVMGSKAFPIGRQKDGSCTLNGDTVLIGGWRVGFGVKAYDSMTGSRNDNGIYALSVYADDNLAYEWRMDELDFDQTRYLNAHIDYAAREQYGAWFHRCFVLPGDHLSNYAHTETLGSVALSDVIPIKITIKAVDANGNASSLTFWALRDNFNMESFVSAPYQFEFPFDADNRIDVDNFSMEIPKGTLYENLQFQYSSSPDGGVGICSPMYHVHNGRTPLHGYYTLRIRPYQIPETLRRKAVIAKCGEGRPDNCGVSWEGDFMTTKVREFGNYCVMTDTVPPKITPVIFDRDMRRKNTIAFRIMDNFAVNGQAEGLSYRGTVDGNWVLFEYDKKRARLTYTFDTHVPHGQHKLKLVVKDDRDNEAIFEKPFTR